jgi:cytochrome P450
VRAPETVRVHLNALLRRVAEAGHMGVMADVAAQLPSRVLVDLLGLAGEAEPTFREWTQPLGAQYGLDTCSTRRRCDGSRRRNSARSPCEA